MAARPDVALDPDFAIARARFRDAASRAGARVHELAHPERGPADEALATDVAVLGRPDARARLLVVSGTHGVEGFAGSACQRAWLASGGAAAAAGDDLTVVLVHAINPFGFAWVRRVNEENVDLNRNCVDFSRPLPENPGYDRLADALVPPRWNVESVRAAANEEVLAFAADHGFPALQEAVSAGQYRHPTGVFFGGWRETWSRRALEAIARTHLGGAERVAVLDLHTGLGPYGVGELIASHPDAHERAQLRAWFGEYTLPSAGTSVSAEVRGDILDGLVEWLAGTPLMGVAIEWGTVDIVTVSDALRADAWLHAHGDPRGPEAPAIKAALRAAFAPPEPEWAAAVWARFEVVSDQATRGLRS